MTPTRTTPSPTPETAVCPHCGETRCECERQLETLKRLLRTGLNRLKEREKEGDREAA